MGSPLPQPQEQKRHQVSKTHLLHLGRGPLQSRDLRKPLRPLPERLGLILWRSLGQRRHHGPASSLLLDALLRHPTPLRLGGSNEQALDD